MLGKVLVEGAVFENTYQRGIQRYVLELFKRVSPPFSLELDKPALVDVPCSWNVIQSLPPSPSRWDILGRLNYRELSREKTEQLCDHEVYHSSFFRLCPVPNIPAVVVVHDMVQEILPHYAPYPKGIIEQKRKALQQAAAVIAISESTKSDLLSFYPELENKVSVVYHGTDHLDGKGCHNADHNDGGAPKPYALFVGDRGGYKNFASLMDAMSEPSWPSDLLLCVVGPSFSDGELAALQYRGLNKKVVHLGRVSDDRLVDVYQNAEVFVFPSLFEGFGFPLLEAQAQGLPVAASDIAVFGEVAGDAFERFSPLDPASIASAVVATLETEKSIYLSDAGLKNYKRYRWAMTADQTELVWRACIE